MKEDKLIYQAIFEEDRNLQFSANHEESVCFRCASSGVMKFGRLDDFNLL